jgi:uncharacterized OB-fold protein
MTLPIINLDRTRSYPPRVSEFTYRFWSSLREGLFETTSCRDCARTTFPPKPFCPHCWSKNLTWVPLSGNGRLYSQTVIHAAPAVFRAETPYRVGIVDLDEGLRIATRIIADNTPGLDTPVEIVVLRYVDGPLFAARPLPR